MKKKQTNQQQTIKVKTDKALGLERLLDLHLILLLIIVSSVLFSQLAQAGNRRYQPRLDESTWQFSGNVLQCDLEQKIPLFGNAQFVAKAGHSDMAFQLKVNRNQPQVFSNASMRAEAPEWRPQQKHKILGTVELAPDSIAIELSHDQAWRLLAELEQGYDPAFYYSDWIDGHDDIEVAMSSVRFGETYTDFIQCVGLLLPFSFEDIQHTVLNFDFNSAKFTPDSRQDLSKLERYLKADSQLEMVLIAGHTDNEGKQSYNKLLSRKRANAVKQFLVNAGVNARQIRVSAYGESRPIASNANPNGRAKNRRVVVRLSK